MQLRFSYYEIHAFSSNTRCMIQWQVHAELNSFLFSRACARIFSLHTNTNRKAQSRGFGCGSGSDDHGTLEMKLLLSKHPNTHTRGAIV